MDMDQFIASKNIKRFKQQLEQCMDERQRSTLRELLAREVARLAPIDGDATT